MNHSSNMDSISSDLEEDLFDLVNGSLPAERFAAVEESIKNDRAVYRRYLEMASLHDSLVGYDWDEKTVPMPRTDKRPKWLVAVVAVAAVIVLGFLAVNLISPGGKPMEDDKMADVSKDQPSFEFAPGAVFDSVDATDRHDGNIYEGDLVAIREGYVSITLDSGVNAVIKSPSTFSITGPNSIRLEKGHGWFQVPKGAEGFSVDLPWMTVIDLGTIFTTEATPSHNIVHVKQGEVEVHYKKEGRDTRTLTKLTEGLLLSRTRDGEVHVESDKSFDDFKPYPAPRLVFHDRLTQLPDQPFAKHKPLLGEWNVGHGDLAITDGKLNAHGKPANIFGEFNQHVPAGADNVVLLSFRSKSPDNFFHSKGFAGVSLFNGEHECLFFGDKSNDSYSWVLMAYGNDTQPGVTPPEDIPKYDLKIQGGEEVFTIRYNKKSGRLEIFRGWEIQGFPLLAVDTDPGMTFDRLRVANGRGGDFSFDHIKLSVGK